MKIDKIKYDNFDMASHGSLEFHGPQIEEVIEISQPKNILEIGFFRGGSSLLWLLGSEAKVTAVDPIVDADVEISLAAATKLKDNFGERFEFLKKKSGDAFNEGDLKEKFDLIYIDGDHSFNGVEIDINIGLKLGIKYFLVDDFWYEVEPAFNKYKENFELIKYFPMHPHFPRIGQPPQAFFKNLNIK